MDEQKQKLIERIRQAQNILVTVSANPSVDQLASAIGLTLALNKMNKHATAVFSGQVPSTIEFLKPQDTLEKDTNSLRDFIIALDKSKADKLRYKVEDQVVRIFITPYKTSISEADLNFSQGDFNVDVVVALGVTEQQDLDAAITAHGRILHDATVASVTTTGQGSLGTINWVDSNASSLSEMATGLIAGLDKTLVDNQIATALLTGIVASTERFSNEKTSPKTMSVSAALMEAGANQQLIATQLEIPPATPQVAPEAALITDISAPAGVGESAKKEPGELEIEHESFAADVPSASETINTDIGPQIQVDENGELHLDGEASAPAAPAAPAAASAASAAPAAAAEPQISNVRVVPAEGSTEPAAPDTSEVKRSLIMEPPKLGEPEITANSGPEAPELAEDELTLPAVSSPLLSHNESVLSPLPSPDAPAAAAAPALAPLPPPLPPASVPSFQPAPPNWQPPEPPASVTPPAPAPAPAPVPDPTPAPLPPAPPAPPQASLADLEHAVDSPHLRISEDGTLTNEATPPAPTAAADSGANVDEARNAVQAAYNHATAPVSPLGPINALNAVPLGPDLHPADAFAAAAPVAVPVPAPAPLANTGFSEPTPGNTPADGALDMPLPSNPFGPGQMSTPTPPPVSSFPGAPASGPVGPPPPPVPPPMVPPQQ